MRELRKINLIDDQVKFMVDRFLQWKLPEDFHPDGGIKFDANEYAKIDPRNPKFGPVGTNLFTAYQAEAMVRFMLNL